MASALDAFNRNRQASLQDTQGLFDQQAQRQAGGMLAGGDYTGAAGALYSGGLLSQGAAVQTMGEGQEDRATKKVADAKAVSKAEQAERLKFLSHGADVLLTLPADQRAAAYAQSIAPALKAMGADDSVIQQGGATLDDVSLKTFAGETKKALLEIQKADDGSILAINRETGAAKEIYKGAGKPEWKEITRADGSTYYQDLSRAGQPVSSPAAGGGAGFDAHIGGVLKREGGFVAKDGDSGAPANYGINQRANPDIDVANLTPERAKELYKTRYWDAIDGDSLPPAAQATVFDAAVNQGVGAAKQMWEQADGDVSKFNALRLQRYRQTRGYDKYGEVWERRVAETGGDALRGGDGRDQISASPTIEGSAPKPKDAPSGYRFKDDGTLTFIPGGPADPKNAKADAKPPTVAQDQAASFTYRVLGANGHLNALADEGIFKPSTVTSQLVRETDGVTRIVARNDTDRRFLQAAKEWLAPILRKDTGAAVTDSELATYMDIYIPRYEDSQAVMKQKAEARQDAMVAISRSAGKLYGERFGDQTFSSKYPSATRRRDQAPAAPGGRPALADIFGGAR